jgi:dTDP-4-dehydrorhamnose 3,5-epimerase-like enzyme
VNIRFLEFEDKGDERGSLAAINGGKEVPFAIERVYYIFNTAKNVRRGYHAHRALKQALIAVSGSCRILLDDGKERVEVALDNPLKGLYLDGLIWREIFDFSSDCVLAVLANAHYDESDYIRDYQKFQSEVKR